MRPSNPTPHRVRATGARHAHGRIFDTDGGAMYVHVHREVGLAHRHYVLRPWQVRTLGLLASRPALLLYLVAALTWGWMASQAARVPLLQQRVTTFERDAERLDSLSATLTELQTRYEQVQRMMGAATAQQASAALRPDSNDTTPRPPAGIGGR